MVQSQEDQVEEGEFLLFCWKIKCESSFTVKIRKQEEHISNDDGRRIRHMELSYSSNLSEVMIKLYFLKGVGCRLVCHVADIGGNGINGLSVNSFNHIHQVCRLLPPSPPLLPSLSWRSFSNRFWRPAAPPQGTRLLLHSIQEILTLARLARPAWYP